MQFRKPFFLLTLTGLFVLTSFMSLQHAQAASQQQGIESFASAGGAAYTDPAAGYEAAFAQRADDAALDEDSDEADEEAVPLFSANEPAAALEVSAQRSSNIASDNDGDFKFSVSNGTVTITRYTGPGGNVVIPDTRDGMPVVGIANKVFYQKNSITGITIPDSVTSIGDSAFYYCYGLTSLTIPNSVKSIGSSAFKSCFSLTSVSIGSGVTNIGEYGFALCSRLTSVSIPGSVTSMGNYAFYDCYSLISVSIGSGVTNIGDYAFALCGLTSVTIPGSVTSIGNSAFYRCSDLTSIDVDVSNPDYSSESGVLYNKSMTMLIQYPAGKAGGFTIPNSVTSIGNNAFAFCSGLTSISIPDSVTSIGYTAFLYCTGLTSISIPNSVTSIGYNAFGGCTGLTSVSIGNGLTSIGIHMFSGCTGLTSVSIGSGIANIGDNAFYNCSGLTSVTIPGSVTSIGYQAFYGCSQLAGAYFYGNAPTMSSEVFIGSASSFKVYYLAEKTGFTNPWYGYPTAVFTDGDNDGFPEAMDNCPAVYNPQQLDADTDGIGDVCDPAPGCGGCGQAACEAIDTDGDGIQNYVDNCPNTANPQQKDADADGIGDVCDTAPGCGGGCGQPVCEGSADTDGDYVRDAIDNCPSVFNPNQLDANGNGTGDCCDTTPGCGGVGQPVCDDFCTL